LRIFFWLFVLIKLSIHKGEAMTKEEFQELLKRYKEGSCSLEEIQKIDSWFARISNKDLELNESEKVQTRDRMLEAIRKPVPEKKSKGLKLLSSTILKVAATFLVGVFAVYLLVPRALLTPLNELAQVAPSAELNEHTNTTPGILKIQLPDSSQVELKPNSTLSYSKIWDEQKREVHLVGEAFFEVVRDSKRPFYVYGGDVVTKVLGTSFSVKAAANAESIEVAVRTGKVSVYKEKSISRVNVGDVSGVVLTPNERVQYFVRDSHWVTSLVEEPKALPSVNKAAELVFSNTPISEIVNSIEATYSIDVILENEASYSCTFTGDVSMMDLYDMLDVICKSIGTSYEVKGTKILITGRGCE
jgi:transmembrane sensor